MLIRLLVLILFIRRNLVLFLPVLLLTLKSISTLLTILLAEQLMTCLFLQLTVLLCFNSESRVVDLLVWVIHVYCFLAYFLGCSLLIWLE